MSQALIFFAVVISFIIMWQDHKHKTVGVWQLGMLVVVGILYNYLQLKQRTLGLNELLENFLWIWLCVFLILILCKIYEYFRKRTVMGIGDFYLMLALPLGLKFESFSTWCIITGISTICLYFFEENKKIPFTIPILTTYWMLILLDYF